MPINKCGPFTISKCNVAFRVVWGSRGKIANRFFSRQILVWLIFVLAWALFFSLYALDDLDGLLSFLERRLSPDGHISNPSSVIFAVTLSPLLLVLLVLLGFMASKTLVRWRPESGSLDRLILLVVLHFLFYYLYVSLVFENGSMEDSLLEWGTFAFALVAGLLFLISGMRGIRFSFFLSFAFLFFAFEEISWGQRVFGFEGPLLFQEKNYQKETNLHNFFNPYLTLIYVTVNVFAFLSLTWFRLSDFFHGSATI
jgi:hypothetical protein